MQNSKPGFFRQLLSYILLLLNIAAVLWLAGCAWASVTNPEDVKYLCLFSLTVPFAVVVNLFFCFFWLFTRKKLRFLLSLFTLLACYKISLTVFGLNYFGTNDFSTSPNRVKIMSWNAHGMGVFNKPRNKAFDKQLIDFIKEEDPDILCLIEYPTPRSNQMKPFTTKIINNNQYKEFRYKDDNILSAIIYLGTAIFSKYPVHNYIATELSHDIYLIQADIDLPQGQTMRMFFTHLNTFGLTDNQKAYIESVKAGVADANAEIDSSKSFLSRLNAGFIRRSKECIKAASIIAQSPYPVLIAGDLNDLPGSFTYTKMRNGLHDAFLDKGKGLGRSYNQILPTLRIDHMFYDPSALKITGFRCPGTSLSDHNPLIANFEIIPPHQR